jgi:hypothetical protein
MKRVPMFNMRWNWEGFNSLQRMVEAQGYAYESAAGQKRKNPGS